MPLKAKGKGYMLHATCCLLPVESWSNLKSVVSMQSSAQEVTMLFKLIAAAKDSWACYTETDSQYNWIQIKQKLIQIKIRLTLKRNWFTLQLNSHDIVTDSH